MLSPETEKFDRGEKLMACASLDATQEYVLVARDEVEVTVFRMAKDWQPEVLPADEIVKA